MHVGTAGARSKAEAMFFLSLLQAANATKELPPNININNEQNFIPFTHTFRYLGFINLMENAYLIARVKKASQQMGALKHL